MKHKIKVLFLTIIITIFSFSNTVFAKTMSEQVQHRVEEAIYNETFYHYMMAYIDILELPQDQQGKFLNELSPLYKKVNTPQVQKSIIMLDYVAKNKDGESYADAESYLTLLNDKDMDLFTKGYLLGELTSWGRKSVFTKDYILALDNLENIKQQRNLESYETALNTINNVKNQKSKEYLLSELVNYKKIIKISEPTK
jgi:hypothetical protein